MIESLIDTLLDNGIVSRKANNLETFIKDNNIKLKLIDKPTKKYSTISNPNIGVIDCETFLNNDSITKIYALGFRTNLSTEPVIYYIDDNLNSDEIVLKLINELLRPKYNNFKFYCHNSSKYDIIYIVKILLVYNESHSDEYKLDYLFRDGKIIWIEISKIINNIKYKFTISDSLCILNDKLSNLAINFGVNTVKGIFPYKFSRESNLSYIGYTPDKSYYEDDVSDDEYKLLLTHNWSFKEVSIKYLKDDLNCLYEVIVKANKQVFLDYGVNMTHNLTIAGLAMRIFLRNFYDNNIPLITKSSMYKEIHEGYYGAITEVYKPYGNNLYYYDVNSLYPYVAQQDLPGIGCYKEHFIGMNPSLENLFGFYYCEIEIYNDNYFGLLPVRNKEGLYFPLGKWRGWYFSEELKFAMQNGYKIKVIKGYSFSRTKDVFKSYVDKIYKIKSNPINNTQKSLAKSLLNNLMGRFGIGLDKPVTKNVNRKIFEELMLTNKIVSYEEITENNIIVSYTPTLDPELVLSNGLDIVKLANRNKDEEKQIYNNASLPISAAITAYGRIHISKLKMDVIKMGGNIFYSDTDSLVTDIKLPDNMVSDKQLGKLKLEYEIDKGIFISGKTYGILTKDFKDKFIARSKGVVPTSVKWDSFLNLLYNNITSAVKRVSKTDWVKGEVKIEDLNVNLCGDTYTKRIKILDVFGNWIDTKPIFVNEIDKSLVLYLPKLSFILIQDHPVFINQMVDKSFVLIYNTPYPINFIDKSFILIDNFHSIIVNETDKSLILYNIYKYLTLYDRLLSLVFYDRKLSLILYITKLSLSLYSTKLSFILIEDHPIFINEKSDKSFKLIYNTLYPINFIDKSFILIDNDLLFTNEINKSLILYDNVKYLTLSETTKLSLILYVINLFIILYNPIKYFTNNTSLKQNKSLLNNSAYSL